MATMHFASNNLPRHLSAALILAALGSSSFFFNDATLGFVFVAFGLLALALLLAYNAGEFRVPPPLSTFESSALFTSLAAYLACVAISPAPNASLLQGYALMAVPAAALVGLGMSKSLWERTLPGLLLLGGALALWGLHNHYVAGKLTHGPFADTNSFAALSNVVILLCASVVLSPGRSQTLRLFASGVAFLSLLAAITATSRGGWISLAIIVLLAAVVLGKALLPGKKLLAALVLVIVSATFSVAPRLIDAFQTGQDKSVSSRWAQLVASKDILVDNPEGVGFGLWSRVYPRYRQPTDIDSAGFHVHNDYLEVFVETSFLGLFAMMAPVVVAGIALLRLSRGWGGGTLTEAVAYCLGFVVIAVHAVVNFIYHGLVISLLAGLLLGRALAYLRAANEGLSRPSLGKQLSAALVTVMLLSWLALSYFAHVSLDAVTKPDSLVARYLPHLAQSQVLERLSRLHPLEPRPALSLALLQLNQAVTPSGLTGLERNELLEQTFANMETAHRRDETDAGILQQMAVAKLYAKEFVAGDRLLARSLELDPTRVASVSLYVQLRLVQKEFNAAREVVNNAMARTSTTRRKVFEEMAQAIDAEQRKATAASKVAN